MLGYLQFIVIVACVVIHSIQGLSDNIAAHRTEWHRLFGSVIAAGERRDSTAYPSESHSCSNALDIWPLSKRPRTPPIEAFPSCCTEVGQQNLTPERGMN